MKTNTITIDYFEKIGTYLKDIRISKNIPFDTVWEENKMSRNGLYAIEENLTYASTRTISKLLRYYKVDLTLTYETDIINH